MDINKLGNTISDCITESITRLINCIASSFEIVFPNVIVLAIVLLVQNPPWIVLAVQFDQEHSTLKRKKKQSD